MIAKEVYTQSLQGIIEDLFPPYREECLHFDDVLKRKNEDLTDSEKYLKALVFCHSASQENSPQLLPETSQLLESLSKNKKYENDPQFQYALALNYFFSQRYDLALNALSQVKKTCPLRECDQSLENFLSENVQNSTKPATDESTYIASQNKRHIAFVCNTKENTHGVPVVMNNIANQLKQNPDYEISFILNNFDNTEIEFHQESQNYFFKNREEFVKFIQSKNIKIDIIHTHTWHLSDHYKPFHTARDKISLPEFLKSLGNPKLIYTDHSNPSGDLCGIKERNGLDDYLSLSDKEKESFLQEHSLDHTQDWTEGWVPTSILSKRQLMDLADIVTFVSDTQRKEERELVPNYNFSEKERVVMNGVDTGKFTDSNLEESVQKLKEKYNLNGHKTVLYAGRMDEEKGIYELAQAANLLKEKDLVFFYLGEASEGVKNKINTLAPKAKIFFPGRISDRKELASYYALANVVAQPTWGECFNQVVAEALAVGTPSVVSDISAPGEIYVRSGAALGCLPKNPKDLAEKIDLLVNNPEVHKTIKNQGKSLVENYLTVEKMYENYLRVYGSL